MHGSGAMKPTRPAFVVFLSFDIFAFAWAILPAPEDTKHQNVPKCRIWNEKEAVFVKTERRQRTF